MGWWLNLPIICSQIYRLLFSSYFEHNHQNWPHNSFELFVGFNCVADHRHHKGNRGSLWLSLTELPSNFHCIINKLLYYLKPWFRLGIRIQWTLVVCCNKADYIIHYSCWPVENCGLSMLGNAWLIMKWSLRISRL